MRSPSAKLDGSEELRGFVVKAYPTQEQAKELYAMQCEWQSARIVSALSYERCQRNV